jgi:hypothetical protein
MTMTDKDDIFGRQNEYEIGKIELIEAETDIGTHNFTNSNGWLNDTLDTATYSGGVLTSAYLADSDTGRVIQHYTDTNVSKIITNLWKLP